MVKPFPRVLLAISAALLFLGGLLHAVAFKSASAVLSGASMPTFYSGSFKALWLIDSATLISLACLLAFIVVRPRVVTQWVLVLLALITAATAVLIYTFVGPFFPAHMFSAAAVAVVVAGLKWRVG